MEEIEKNKIATEQSNQSKQIKIAKTYKVFDFNIETSNSTLIDFYKTSMKMLATRFQLVGFFNDKGQYIIKDEIKKDLVKMYKEINDSGEFFYKANIVYMKKYFYFDVKISLIDDKKAKASLYLSEFVDDALKENYIISHIADYIDEYDSQFRIKVRKVFNLVDVALKNEDYEIADLAIFMQDIYDVNKYVGNLYDISAQIYVMRILKLLENAGPIGIKILKRYKELIVDKEEEYKNDKFKNSRYKYLLDRAINENGGLEKLPIQPEKIKDIVSEVNKSAKAIESLQSRAGAVEIMRTKDGKNKEQNNKTDKDPSSSKNAEKSYKKIKSSTNGRSSSKKSKSSVSDVKSSGGVFWETDNEIVEEMGSVVGKAIDVIEDLLTGSSDSSTEIDINDNLEGDVESNEEIERDELDVALHQEEDPSPENLEQNEEEDRTLEIIENEEEDRIYSEEDKTLEHVDEEYMLKEEGDSTNVEVGDEPEVEL